MFAINLLFGQQPSVQKPQCGAGEQESNRGGCIAISEPTCKPGETLSARGGCKPTQGCSSVDSSGKCIGITAPPTTKRTPTTPSTVRPPTTTQLPPTTGIVFTQKTQPTTPGGTVFTTTPTGGTVFTTTPTGGTVPVTVPTPVQADNFTTVRADLIPVGCAAALKCVKEIYCTIDGVVSQVPVVLNKEQELRRAPTVACRDAEIGIGKCCRDPTYQDPWPSANLVNGVDDGRYAEDDSLGKYQDEFKKIAGSLNRNTRRRRSKRATKECGVRNLNTSPPGSEPTEANFAEITWQAMILKDSNRSLLCGGAIIRPNAVLTTAHCLEGQQSSDILIKGGEWKLGIDDEPLPFQIVKVAAILRHPKYNFGSNKNDLAILVLEENLRLTQNIGEICLPEPNLIPTQNCIVTGWGKRILQLHAKGAIMHKIDVNVMEVQQCQKLLGKHFSKVQPDYNTNTLCGFSDTVQCEVDYGSALACQNEFGQYTLSAIYAWDTGCKKHGQIGGYVIPDVEWIENILSTPLKQLKRIEKAAKLQIIA